jgi:hypothetical protein
LPSVEAVQPTSVTIPEGEGVVLNYQEKSPMAAGARQKKNGKKNGTPDIFAI